MTSPATPGAQQDPAVALAEDFSRASRTLFAAGGGQATLAEVARLAVATIEGCDFAGTFPLTETRSPPPCTPTRS